MNRTWPKPAQGIEMLRRAIALVLGKAITRMVGVKSLHLAIPRNLGENRRRHDRCMNRIALNHRFGDERPDRKSTRLNSSHSCAHRMPSSACKKKHINIQYTLHTCSLK